jgi:hypothetical protein
LANSRFHLSLLVTSSVVSTVLLEITFGARSFNLRCDIATARAFEMFKLCLKAICCLLG